MSRWKAVTSHRNAQVNQASRKQEWQSLFAVENSHTAEGKPGLPEVKGRGPERGKNSEPPVHGEWKCDLPAVNSQSFQRLPSLRKTPSQAKGHMSREETNGMGVERWDTCVPAPHHFNQARIPPHQKLVSHLWHAPPSAAPTTQSILQYKVPPTM